MPVAKTEAQHTCCAASERQMYDMCAEAMLHEMQRFFAVAGYPLAFVCLEALMQSEPILLDAMSCSMVSGRMVSSW